MTLFVLSVLELMDGRTRNTVGGANVKSLDWNVLLKKDVNADVIITEAEIEIQEVCGDGFLFCLLFCFQYSMVAECRHRPAWRQNNIIL